MYKVRFVLSRHGYRKRRLEGIYIPPSPPPAISDMKRDCEAYIRGELEKRNPMFRTFAIDIVEFRRLRTDFLYNAGKEDG